MISFYIYFPTTMIIIVWAWCYIGTDFFLKMHCDFLYPCMISQFFFCNSDATSENILPQCVYGDETIIITSKPKPCPFFKVIIKNITEVFAQFWQFFEQIVLILKDEFKIEPRYAHKKNLNKSEKKHMEGQNWLMKTILQSKSLEKTEIYQISML